MFSLCSSLREAAAELPRKNRLLRKFIFPKKSIRVEGLIPSACHAGDSSAAFKKGIKPHQSRTNIPRRILDTRSASHARACRRLLINSPKIEVSEELCPVKQTALFPEYRKSFQIENIIPIVTAFFEEGGRFGNGNAADFGEYLFYGLNRTACRYYIIYNADAFS